VPALLDAADRLVLDDPDANETHALVAVHRGRLVLERYGPGHGPDELLISWSTAKSMTHSLVGLCVGDGLLDVAAPAPVPEWADDERSGITLQHLLNMRDGLDFNEEYEDVGVSHVVDMLFVAGKDDVAGYAAARPLRHPPGAVWSSGSCTVGSSGRSG
jgi:CubicO group peptidase (beta-lactamase class C family)